MAEAVTAATNGAVPPGMKLGFFKLIVSDVEALERFYVGSFGMERRAELERPTFREVMLGTPGDTFTLVLLQRHDRPAVEIGSGHGPVGFFTGDLDGAIASATGHGARLTSGPIDAPGMRVAFLTDPDGHELELLQRTRPAKEGTA